ncbi:MAG: peptide deformylase, partial [Actinomycetaceae bacterium]|nr:peptide deformylase [Actinomycetaceae bacterium]
MAILPITITGEPVLHRVNKSIEVFDENLVRLVDDMFETMYEAPGVGLAAPQVGIDARLFVYAWEDEETGEEYKGVAVNPELYITPTPIAKLKEEESEGCLSVPGYYFPTRRAEKAILR